MIASIRARNSSRRNRTALMSGTEQPQGMTVASAFARPVRSPAHRDGEASGENSPTFEDLPSTHMCRIQLINGGSQVPNVFISLMFIHVRSVSVSKTNVHRTFTTSRRVLFDTGADFNLISHGAHHELNLAEQPSRRRVRSIAGFTDLDCAVVLEWHFPTHDSDLYPSQNTHHSTFHVLPSEADAKFDCILGRKWIHENWAEFVALVELNMRKGCA